MRAGPYNSRSSRAGIAQLVERNLAKVEVASSRLVSRSSIPPGKTIGHIRFPRFVFGGVRRRGGRVVMQRPAKPSTPVRFRPPPPLMDPDWPPGIVSGVVLGATLSSDVGRRHPDPTRRPVRMLSAADVSPAAPEPHRGDDQTAVQVGFDRAPARSWHTIDTMVGIPDVDTMPHTMETHGLHRPPAGGTLLLAILDGDLSLDSPSYQDQRPGRRCWPGTAGSCGSRDVGDRRAEWRRDGSAALTALEAWRNARLPALRHGVRRTPK